MDFNGESPVRPFRFLNRSMLPTLALKNSFSTEWYPILSKMENAPDLTIPSNDEDITPSFIKSSYEIGTEYLKNEICGYIWRNFKKHLNWSVATWSRWTQAGNIKKYGNEKETSNLPPDNHRNKRHERKRTLQRGPSKSRKRLESVNLSVF